MSEERRWTGKRAIMQAAVMVAGIATYVLAPWSGVALSGWMIFTLTAGAWPGMALRLIVLSTPFYLFPKTVTDLPFSPTEAMLVGLLVAWLVPALRRTLRSGGPGPRRLRLDWPIVLFLLGAVFAGLAATDLGTHARNLRVVVLEPLLFYYLAKRESQTEDEFFGLVDAWLLAGVAVSLFAFYQYLFTSDTIVAEGVARARGLYGSPNNLGIYLARVLPVAGCLAVWGERRRGLYAAAFAVVAAALALTFSLGAWLGAAVALLFVALLGSRRRFALGIVGVLALALLGGWLLDLPRIVSHFSPDAATWRWRVYVWQAGINMVRDHPLLGVGLDNFLKLYPSYMLPEAWPEPGLSHPHNLLLDLWLSTGLLGLVGGVWLIGRQLWRAWRSWRFADSVQLRAVGLGLFASTVDLVVHGSFDNAYFLVDLAMVFWLVQALAGTRPRPYKAAGAAGEGTGMASEPAWEREQEEEGPAPWETPSHAS